MKLTGFFLLITLSFCSCSLQKRLYTGGFYVDKGKTHSETSQSKYSEKKDSLLIITQEANREQAVADVPASRKTAELISLPAQAPGIACDTLYMVSGEKLLFVVQSISGDQIKCKPCNNPHGEYTTFVKSSLLKICYSYGKTEEFSHANDGPDQKYTPQFNLVFKHSDPGTRDKIGQGGDPGSEKYEALIRRLADQSHNYGIAGIVCFFIPLIGPVLSLIFAITAIAKGTQAIHLMGRNLSLLSEYSKRAKDGRLMGTLTLLVILFSALLLFALLFGL